MQIRNLITQALPSAKRYFDEWQLPTEPERPGDVLGFFAGSGKERRSDDHGNIRVDYNLGAHNHITARYTRGHPYQTAPRTAMLSNTREFIGLNENIAGTFTRVWSPRITSGTGSQVVG